MQYTAPHYYSKFQCIADKCPDTCCAGWQIAIDHKALKKYRQTKGPIGNRLKNEINWKEKIFNQYDGRCAFLNEDNLCDLYLDGGENLFCTTCRTYPRHVEEFEGLKEISLSLSCPVAAEMILKLKEPVKFIEKEGDGHQKEDDNFDFFLFTKLEDARDLIFDILQNRNLNIETRIAMVLALAHDLQIRIDNNALFEIDGLLERYADEHTAKWFIERLGKVGSCSVDFEERRHVLRKLFSLFDGLEVLRSDWKKYIQDIKRILFKIEPDHSNKDYVRLREMMQIPLEQLMIYFVYTYFCGAVYDEDAYGRMKFAVSGSLIVMEMTFALLVKTGLDKFTEDVFYQVLCEAARRYSREIEHSDVNKSLVLQRLGNEQLYDVDAFLALL